MGLPEQGGTEICVAFRRPLDYLMTAGKIYWQCRDSARNCIPDCHRFNEPVPRSAPVGLSSGGSKRLRGICLGPARDVHLLSA